MSKEKIDQVIDEVYEFFMLQNGFKYENGLLVGKMSGLNQLNVTYWLTKEEFINKCKTNPEFSETLDLKIEERELDRDERIDLYCKEYTNGIRGNYEPPFDDFIDAKLTTRNIPTKLITLTYKENKIESYE
jgi:hypothetical protein